MNRFIFIALTTVVLFSCKTGEVVSNDEPKIISKSDHPYYTAFHKGLRFKLQGRIDDAIKQFDLCLSMRENDPAVYYALSQLHLMKDDFTLSSENIKKAAELDPDNTWYIQELAYMYYEMNDFPKAVENFEKLTKAKPENVEWLFGYSEALIRNKQVKEAIDVLNDIEDQIGMNPQLSSEKYSLYMELGDEEAALNELAVCRLVFPKSPQLIGTYVQHYFGKNEMDKAIEMLEELVEADPENGRAHLALADIYRQQGKLNEAMIELEKAVRSSDVDIDSKMNVLFSVFEYYPELDDEVLPVIEALVETHAQEAKAWSMMGDFLLKKKDNDGALDAYRTALEFDKSRYPIWDQVLIMEYQAGKFELLYTDSKACLELFPNVPTVYLLFGVAANLTERYEEALDPLTMGVELVINDRPLKAEFKGQLAEAYFGIGDKKEGIKAYQEAIELDPASNLIRNNFAFRLASEKTELDLAESLIDQVLERRDDVAQYQDTKGFVLFQKGEYDSAKQYFEAAYEMDPTDGLILEHLGDVQAKKGDSSKAKMWWQRAIDAGRENENLRRKLKDGKYYDPN